MSPILRRYRAERLLRQEFEGLREQVLIVVRKHLSLRGVRLDPTDLDACYAMAGQGLYASMLTGQPIEKPAGWLMLVTFRRAIDEHRSHLRRGGRSKAISEDPDFAEEIDERDRVRHLFEGLRGTLNPRECEAASL